MSYRSEEMKKVSYHIIDTLKHVRAVNENFQRLIENYDKDFLSFPNIVSNIREVADRYPDLVIGKICANSFNYDVPQMTSEQILITFLKHMSEYVMKHDISKINGLEFSGYKDVVYKLSGLEYGTKEHKEAIKELDEPFLLHATANRHHPEFFSADRRTPEVEKMNIVDFTEMILDWTAAAVCRGFTFRLSSVEHKKKELGLDDVTVEIIQRNIKLMLPENLITNDINK